MEEVVHALHTAETGLTVQEVASALGGMNESTVRSHLTRNRDTRYVQDGDGRWYLTEEYDSGEE